jgi:hypothetical protein
MGSATTRISLRSLFHVFNTTEKRTCGDALAWDDPLFRDGHPVLPMELI